jgi:SAM-dependent methyltransferase
MPGMNILIACHCKKTHMPVYLTDSLTNPKAQYYSLYDEQQYEKIKNQYGIANIDYIDIHCQKDANNNNQFSKWSDLPRKYDIIFLIHCPIFGLFYDEEEYKYIDSLRKMYSDMREHLKPRGYIYIEKNIPPSFIQWDIPQSQVEKADNPKHIRKVYDDIFNTVKYRLDILDNKDIDIIPFHITTDNKYSKYSEGRQRVMKLMFPRMKKTRTIGNSHSREIKKIKLTKKNIHH